MNQQTTLKYILKDKLQTYINKFGFEEKRINILYMIYSMLKCGEYENGYMSYFCVHCKKTKRMKFSCRARLCSKCGQELTKKNTKIFVNRMINKIHRHITFTIPKLLWAYYLENTKLQQDLVRKAYKSLKDVMELYLRVPVTPGCVSVIHTYGRDLKVNFHIHMIVTEGGMAKSGKWINFHFFPFEKRGKIFKTLNEIWMENVLDSLRKHLRNKIILEGLIEELNSRYSNGFYIHGPKENRIKTNRKAKKKADYITRYVRHPIISDSRIEKYDGELVTFWYNYPTTKERRYVKMNVLDFINKVLLHIPQKNFKMVLYYGLYSPHYPQKEKVQLIFDIDGKVENPNNLNWRNKSYLNFGRDPLICTECAHEMIFICVVVKRRDKYRIFYKLGYDDLDAIDCNENEEEFISSFNLAS